MGAAAKVPALKERGNADSRRGAAGSGDAAGWCTVIDLGCLPGLETTFLAACPFIGSMRSAQVASTAVRLIPCRDAAALTDLTRLERPIAGPSNRRIIDVPSLNGSF